VIDPLLFPKFNGFFARIAKEMLMEGRLAIDAAGPDVDPG
jgi:hypothetical protein